MNEVKQKVIAISSHITKMGKNLEDIQEMNRSLVLRLIRQSPDISRATLAKLSGLKQSTITNIVRDLLAWGIIQETGFVDGAKGRRSIGLAINEKACHVIGVRLTRQCITAGMFDLDGKASEILRADISFLDGPKQAIACMEELVAKLLQRYANHNIVGIGLAAPGPLLKHEGRIVLMTDFPGWEGISLTEVLTTRFGLPVYIEHDANAGALGECWFGPRRNVEGTTIYVAVGQGVGAGIIIDGALYSGASGIAGEIGHMSIAFDGPPCQCGSRGCLELYCSTTALVRDYRRDLIRQGLEDQAKPNTPQDIFAAARAGDSIAQKAIRTAGWYLGFGLVGLINVLNPNRIVIGDEFAEAGEPFLQAVIEAIKGHALPEIAGDVLIELSTFEPDPVLVGASSLAFERILRNPSLIKQSTRECLQ